MSATRLIHGLHRTLPLAAFLATSIVMVPLGLADRGINRVTKLAATEDSGSAAVTVITIKGTTTPTFTVYKLAKPERVVIDVANAKLDEPVASDALDVNSWAVGQVTAQALGGDDAQVARVIIGFARPSAYRVKTVGNDVVVTVTPREPRPEMDQDAGASEALAKKDAEATEAKEDAERARREAKAAKQDADKARKDAAAAKAGAETARREAAKHQADADKQKAEATERLAEADRRMAQANDRMKEADEQKRLAEKTRKQSEKALADAEARTKDAEQREKLAGKKQADADKKAADAERQARVAMKRAADAEAAGDADAERKRDEAAKAAALADARRKDAEQAASDAERRRNEAETRRKEADSSRLAAEKSQKQAEDARADAERAKQAAVTEKQEAETARDQAERARKDAVAARDVAKVEKDRAEKARAAAEDARRREEARAAVVEKKRREEENRARVAADARGREEEAAHAAEQAAANAEARRADAEKALAEVERSRHAADDARKDAERRAKASERAAADARRIAEEQGAASDASRKAKAEADRLATARREADDELARRQKQLAADEARAKDARRSREVAHDDATEARAAADGAHEQRVKEEKRRAAVEAERIVEEKRLAEAVRKREVEEAKLASAEKKRRAAEDELARTNKAAAKAIAKTEPEPEPEPVAVKPPAPTKAKEKPAQTAKGVKVKDVDYVDQADTARVVLTFTGSTRPQVIVASGRQAILEITGVEIPAKLERSLDTSDFPGPVTAISSYRDPRDGNKVRIVVDLSEATASALVRSGDNTWHWDFEKPVAMRRAKKKDGTATIASKKKPRLHQTTSYEPPVVGGYGAASTPVTSKTVAQKKPRRVYRAQKIDLDFKDADVHNVLRLLAKIMDVNIVVPDEIKGTVSVRLSRVPADQALDVILASKGLGYRRSGNVIRVAFQKDLDTEDEANAAKEAARQRREAPEPEVFTLNYMTADEAAKTIEGIKSGNPNASIEIDPRTNSVIITDLVENRRRMIQLLQQLDTQTPQIQIEARIVEARSTFLREVGVQWGVGAIASGGTGNPTGLIFPSTVGVFGGAVDSQTQNGGIVGPPDFAVNLPAAVGSGQGGALGFTFGSVGGNFNLNLRLSAAEDIGSVRIISAPKITVLNNIKAEISQGVSIPISVVSANGVQTQFVEANLALIVTPHVSQRDCSIQMNIEVSKDEADFVNTGSRGDPTILTKNAKTTMLVADGETSVIGGIYTRATGLGYSKVPYLADIPILGFFFRSRRESDDRTEMLIFITPKITNKASLRCE